MPKTGKATSTASGSLRQDQNGKDSCPSLPLYEQELKPVLMDVFKEADVNADELIERYISMYRSLCQDDTGLAQEIDMQRTRRDLAEKKKEQATRV